MDNKFEELKREVTGSMKSQGDLGDVFLKFGITPDNPESLKEVIKDAGIDEEITPEKAAEMVKNMTENLPPEMKKYMADMIENVSKSISADPMPDDVQNLWKTGKSRRTKRREAFLRLLYFYSFFLMMPHDLISQSLCQRPYRYHYLSPYKVSGKGNPGFIIHVYNST